MIRDRNVSHRATGYLAICLLAWASSLALAGPETVDEQLVVTPGGLTSVQITRGSLSVVGWDRSEIHVEGTLDEQVERFIFETRGDVTRIEVILPKPLEHRMLQRTTDLTIHMPSGSDLEVSGVSLAVGVSGVSRQVSVGVISGDINVRGGRGQIELQTVSGQIDLLGADGRIFMRSVSGDLLAREVEGEARYSTVSGRILIEAGSDDQTLESVSGDIDVRGEGIRHLRGQIVSGDIRFDGSLAPDASVALTTISGTVEMVLSGEVNGTFDVSTGSGRIRNHLTSDEPTRPQYGPGRSLRFKVSDAASQVNLSARSGDVILTRSGVRGVSR
jgi:DUF4097 and DUF4098 domain-containing protein YvlB